MEILPTLLGRERPRQSRSGEPHEIVVVKGAKSSDLTITAVGANRRTQRVSLEVPRSPNAAPHAIAGPTRRVETGAEVRDPSDTVNRKLSAPEYPGLGWYTRSGATPESDPWAGWLVSAYVNGSPSGSEPVSVIATGVAGGPTARLNERLVANEQTCLFVRTGRDRQRDASVFWAAAVVRPASTAEVASVVRLCHEAGVAVVAGESFGAPGHLRFSYALGPEDIERGMSRVSELIETL